jgi:hypothetical protein
MRIRFSIPLIIAAATQMGATDCGEVIRDPGFDLWCGDALCSWKIVRGDAQRVSTWHDGDSGVELLGDDAAIAQLTPVNYHDGKCIRFELVANVEDTAEATLAIDVYGDGKIEKTEPIPTSRWKPLTYKIKIAKPFTGVRFELSKRGPGKAAFAKIGAAIDSECAGLTEIPSGPAPVGAYCEVNAECESDRCRLVDDPYGFFGVSYRCTDCDASTCAAGEACGLDDPTSPVLAVPVACVPAGGDELGEQCETGAECASGICNARACSTCDPAHPCANGEACSAAWPFGPNVCAAGAGHRTSGEACATDSDCASQHCNGGVRKACPDGRPCGSEINCPVESGLVPGACTVVGVQGGSCE